ncbi:MAG TPA: hypothetical protein VGO68_00720 [Pyrinomonadaceae bacterium]|jgi:hypothetical protein|nr:hypothetical protein [Pyrinomonadaceae bacterium]
MRIGETKKSRVAWLLLFVSLSCGVMLRESQAQSPAAFDDYGRWLNGISEPWFFRSEAYSETEASLAMGRWQNIGTQNAAGRDEWAGDYRAGDLHAAFLRWSPENGFVLLWVFTCEANVTDLQYGSVSVSPGAIRLDAERPQSGQTHAGDQHNHGRHSFKSLALVPIKWGADRYLVPERQVRPFAEYLAGVGAFSDNSEAWDSLDYYARSSGEPVDLFTTAPVFPPGYEKFMRRPVAGKVVSVGRSIVRVQRHDKWWNDLIIPVTIDAGSSEGVRPGMTLYLESPDLETVEITRVSLHAATGVIKRNIRKKPGVRIDQWDDGLPLKLSPIAVGLRLSSSQLQAFSVIKK